ncbi:MAG: GPO family capsid scaffolding protein [Enterovibrio sp.]
MKKSKFFCVFTEGHTTDGRVVERQWITDIVETYDAAKYGARVWLEHIRGLTPDSAFKAYGDVTAVKAEEVDGKLSLFAQIDPTDELVEMNKKRQKIYTSVEIDLNFAGTGRCGLVGLAVTDSPASLGTEMLAFSAGATINPLSARKQKPENIFTSAVEAGLEFNEIQSENETGLFFAKVKALLSKNKEKSDFSESKNGFDEIADWFAKEIDKIIGSNSEFSLALNKSNQNFSKLQAELSTLNEQFSELKHRLEKEEQSGQQRSLATGGNNTFKTDC